MNERESDIKMAQTLKLKRGNNTNLAGLTLAAGEPAFVLDTGKLYVGNGTDKVLINPDIPKNSETTDKLKTARTISLSGDITGSVLFDGSSDVTIETTEKASGVAAGIYTKVTVDSKGKVTSGTNITAVDVGLENVTNESKTTMFTNPIFTGIPIAPTPKEGSSTTQIATTEFVTKAVSNGNAGTATKLANTVDISLIGDATGSTSFDGSSDVSINVTISNIDGGIF